MQQPGSGAKLKRRLDNLQMWKPGQSGNPKGRPPQDQSIAAIARHFLSQTPEGQKKQRNQIFVEAIYDCAILDKDMRAATLLWNYVDGKPRESVDVTSAGEKMSHLVIYRPEKNEQ